MSRLMISRIGFFFAQQHVVAFRAIRTLSRAYSKSSLPTLSLPLRLAQRAASLTRLRISAPVKPDRARRHPLQIDVRIQRHILAMHLEDASPAFVIRPIDDDVRSNRPGRSSGGIEHVGAIGGGQTITAGRWAKPSIFAEDLG